MTRGLHDTACEDTVAEHTEDTVEDSAAVADTGDTDGSPLAAGPIAEVGDSIGHDTDTGHDEHAPPCQQSQE